MVKLLELCVGASGKRISEALPCAIFVMAKVFYLIDDDGDIVAAVGEARAKGVQHIEFLLSQRKLAIHVSESDHYQEPDFLEVGSHGPDVVEVDEFSETGVVSVAGHVDDGAFVVAALLVEVGLLGH